MCGAGAWRRRRAGSLCVIAETLYYLSPDGVMAWSGSLPAKVSGALDTGKLTAADWAMGGQLDARYYLYLHRRADGDGSGRLLVYDTEKGLWHEESPAGTEMVSTGQQLYLWDGSALWAAGSDRETEGEEEANLRFEAVTGDIGMSMPGRQVHQPGDAAAGRAGAHGGDGGGELRRRGMGDGGQLRCDAGAPAGEPGLFVAPAA